MKTSLRMLLAAGMLALLGCADENDPKTWVKRLDEPAQRGAAVKRLGQFFDDAMTTNQKNRDAAPVKALLDMIVEPMAQAYTKGGLDDKTRVDLIKALSDMRDPRTGPALAKALNDYESGKSNNDDVRYASQAVKGLAEQGKMTDQAVIDAVWNCFTKFAPTKSKSINATTDLHDAVRAVKSPSYGAKAVPLLKKPVVLDDKSPVNDELDFWQTTAVQIIGDLKYDDDAAIKALVGVMLTQNKLKLMNPAKTALLKMPKKAVPVLASALSGTDPEYAKMAAEWGPEKGYVIPLIDVLSYSSTQAALDAILAAMPGADNDTNRAAFTQTLVLFPTAAKTVDAFKAGYAKLPPIADGPKGGPDTGRERMNLLVVAGDFFEPSLAPWILSEAKAAKGDFVIAAQVNALQAAIKLSQPDQKKAVEDAVKALEAQKVSKQEQEAITNIRSAYDAAMSGMDKCQKDATCYLGVLDETVPSAPPAANWKAIKAAAMCATLGNTGTATALVGKLNKVLNPGARLAVSSAIDHLLPKGDKAVADQLDKIVADDTAGTNKQLLAADDALVKVALRLRARAGQ